MPPKAQPLQTEAAPAERTQRVRDPVHGLIVFRVGDPLAQLAWRLIATPEFQRLRRIKQLGVSEFVFPGATHSRFAHSLGVFHVARTLVEIIKRELGQKFDPTRAEVAVIAALLHDLGHGPFSHAFEAVQKTRGMAKKHETWSAEIIRNTQGKIRPLLDAYRPNRTFTDEVAHLIEAEDPVDIYHAVVSSSFDADRLDYLRRDRLMTGTGAGAIDFDWLMEQLRVAEVEIEPAEANSGDAPQRVPTFCFDPKALPAAEQFLLARYTLHEQVYLHKTTRCVEQMIAKLLKRAADLIQQGRRADTGLDANHPLVRFFQKDGATLANFLALDDVVVGGAIEQMEAAPDTDLSGLARRLRDRELYKTLDLGWFGHDVGRQRKEARRIDRQFADELKNDSVIKDEGAAIGIYTQIGGDDDKTHKKLHILDAGQPREITELSVVVRELAEKKRQFTRYYFETESDRNRARSPNQRETG
ncbi:MAG TPA: HD domain-containing protein [Xanthobacteraceae bacterium]|nr:HD domain-containing protein [Xanthobacteraceae bacterium]